MMILIHGPTVFNSSDIIILKQVLMSVRPYDHRVENCAGISLYVGFVPSRHFRGCYARL